MTSATTTAAANQAHNNTDVWFVRHMIPHHQQAVEMSDIVLAKQGIDPRVTELARQIKAEQSSELEMMQGWLKQWGDPPMPSGDMTTTAMSGGDGMLTERELTALRDAQAPDANTLFLTQMIAHHQGAIAMAQTETEDGQYPAAVQLARSIVTTQQREIDTMKNLLSSL
jgi:uncharacterized protein (DUF305 family)